MEPKSWKRIAVLTVCLTVVFTATAWGGTFGKVVTIGGHASDLALDEARGVLYVANFTANRIEVVSLADLSIKTSMNVAPQPGSLALSPDGRYLVVAHFGNFVSPNTPSNALTVIDRNTSGKQTFALGYPPVGVAFGIDGRALVVTTHDFALFDPVSGTTEVLETISGLVAKTLPVPSPNFPPNIVAASVAASGDGMKIYGLADTIEFGYDVTAHRIGLTGFTSSPPQGPRVVSVNQDGSAYLAGWVLHGGFVFNKGGGIWNLAQFPDAEGLLNIGSHVIDSARGLIYAQVSQKSPEDSVTRTGAEGGNTTPATPAIRVPVLQMLDADNLTVRERILLPENLAGKSVLSSDGMTMYSVSDSGLMVLPVGSLDKAPRVIARTEDIVFRGNFCDRQASTQEISIVDPGGGNTDFSLSVGSPGVAVSPTSGTTPATVRVTVEPGAFQNRKGTSLVSIAISSKKGVNLPLPVRVVVSVPEPDQRGTLMNVPGKLVDLLADPVRDRFYIIRQDTNEVLVFDGSTYNRIATLRTGNTPTQMAITFDRRYLLVGNDNSQLANVYDLETLQSMTPIRFPGGHYPRSLAASGRAILAASRVVGEKHTIDRVDLATRSASPLPTLGVYENSINIDTALAASPNGASIIVAERDGTVLLYNANADTFTASRKDFSELGGAYAASSFDQFVVGSHLLNASLVPIGALETGTGQPSGFAFVDQFGFRTTAASAASAGVIQRVDLQTAQGIRATRTVEAPILGNAAFAFTRTVAPLYSRNAIINLSTSGFTVLPWNYDASVAPPRIATVVNAADRTEPVAPGGLISVTGQDLSPMNLASKQVPLPTALGESCLTVNGVPVPILFVSAEQVNAQLPFNIDGNVTLILRTPGGVSDNFNLTIMPGAPSVFRAAVTGAEAEIPTVVRAGNGLLVTPSNPIHRGEHIVIFLTGLGRTNPAIEAGVPAPSDPLSTALVEPTVTLGGVSLPLSYAGLTPGEVGVYQINAQVPGWVPPGLEQPLVITQGTGSTTLLVRVVE